MATQWLIVNYNSYKTTYAMFEKYNASMISSEFGAGSGGEYEVQVDLQHIYSDNPFHAILVACTAIVNVIQVSPF